MKLLRLLENLDLGTIFYHGTNSEFAKKINVSGFKTPNQTGNTGLGFEAGDRNLNAVHIANNLDYASFAASMATDKYYELRERVGGGPPIKPGLVYPVVFKLELSEQSKD